MRVNGIVIGKAFAFLALTIVPAIVTQAATLQYQVNYLVTAGCTKIGPLCLPVQTGIVIPGAFTLPSADLNTPGAYDISSTFASGLLVPVSGFSESVQAVVSGGKLTDVSVSYGWTAPTPVGSDSYSLSASGGKWSSLESAFVQGGNGSLSTMSGTYAINSIPEPGTAGLLLAGSGLLVAAGKRHRSQKHRL